MIMSTMNYLLYMKRKMKKQVVIQPCKQYWYIKYIYTSYKCRSVIKKNSFFPFQIYVTETFINVPLYYPFLLSPATLYHHNIIYPLQYTTSLCCNPFNFLCTAFRNRISFLDYTQRIISATRGITYFQMIHQSKAVCATTAQHFQKKKNTYTQYYML